MNRSLRFGIIVCLTLLASVVSMSMSHGATTIYGTSWQERYNSTTSAFSSTYEGSPRIGTSYSGSGLFYMEGFFVFQLPDLGAIVNPFTEATLSFAFSGYPGNGQVGVVTDVYGFAASSTSTLNTSMFYIGANDTTSGVTKLADNFLNSASYAADTVFTLSGTTILDYFNAQYAGGSGAGKYIVLRFNPDATPTSSGNSGYNLYGDSAVDAFKPSFTFTTVPEPNSLALLFLGATTLLGLTRNRRHSL